MREDLDFQQGAPGGPGQRGKPGLEGIRELQDCSDGVGQADSCCLRIEGQGDGLRERIFRCCAQENMPILELNSQRLSLEQVFLQLTEEEGKAEEA